jgi:hypothetical protein
MMKTAILQDPIAKRENLAAILASPGIKLVELD